MIYINPSFNTNPLPNNEAQRLPTIYGNHPLTSIQIKKNIYFIAPYALFFGAYAALIGGTVILFYTTAKILAILPIILPSKELVVTTVLLTAIGSITVLKTFINQGFKIEGLGISFGFQQWRKAARDLRNKQLTTIKFEQGVKNYTQNHPLSSMEEAKLFTYKDMIESTTQELNELEKKIQDIQKKINADQLHGSAEDLRVKKEKLSSYLREFYFKVITQVAAAKIGAAYYYYRTLNPTQNASIERFAEFKPPSFLEASQITCLEKKGTHLFGFVTILYSYSNQETKGWTIEELLNTNYQSLSKKIFQTK